MYFDILNNIAKSIKNGVLYRSKPKPVLNEIMDIIDFTDDDGLEKQMTIINGASVLFHALGEALIEQEDGKSIIVLYGWFGSEGKNKLAEMLTSLILDATIRDLSLVPEEVFGLRRVQLQGVVLVQQHQGNHIGSPVTLEDGSIALLLGTAFILTNHLPLSEKAAINDSIGRKIVIYHMDKPMCSRQPVQPYEIDNIAVVKLVSLAISVFNSNPRVRYILAAVALYTFFRRNVDKITAGLIYDPTSNEDYGSAGRRRGSWRRGAGSTPTSWSWPSTGCRPNSPVSPRAG
ncbi:hypothetical protein BDU57DRAFT_543616 [Ampelomyces quisqualis]|uniref:Uncharacterized protein n=1 Tax=Ampelomyces quisqualis TaxID=50730 RepID=A0A6A5Q8B7_AMPQU|nr:hypothetical protein BDU57DRAFT_543616 [Ampelomyces quisqualis]